MDRSGKPGRVRAARRGGFTLIELLIVVAIIGIVAAILVPNLLDAISKAKQKKTMAAMRSVGSAAMSWFLDQHSAAAAGTSLWDLGAYPTEHTADEISELLVPRYIQEVPQLDAWGHTLGYHVRDFVTHGLTSTFFAVRSGGRHGVFDATTYETGAFVATDYDQDIVWADGYFIRWPGGLDRK